MTQTAVYTLEQFIHDCQGAFRGSSDPRERAGAIASSLERLLAVPGWLESRLGLPSDGGAGTYELHRDAELGHPDAGFLVLAHVHMPGGHGTSAHDHGPCFVVYGAYQGGIIQRTYRWEGGQPGEAPVLKPAMEIQQAQGQAAYFLPGVIHETINTSSSRTIYIRVTSQDLTQVWRHRYSLVDGSVRATRGGGA